MAGSDLPTSRAPARWLVLEVEEPADEGPAGLCIEALTAQSGRGVEARDGRLLAYFDRIDGDIEAFVAHMRGRLAGAAGNDAVGLGVRWQPHEAWADLWRRGLGARRVTERLVVSPTWEAPALRPGDHLVSLDPGMAFGSAEHPTTRGCLRLLDERVRPGERVADVGTGSGILGIAAALFGARHMLALEVDPWACAAAEENTRRNSVAERVSVVQASVGTEFLPEEEGSFDRLVANIEADPLVRWLAGFRRGIRPGGWMILGGILEGESGRVEDAAVRAGFGLEATDIEGGWWSAAFLG